MPATKSLKVHLRLREQGLVARCKWCDEPIQRSQRRCDGCHYVEQVTRDVHAVVTLGRENQQLAADAVIRCFKNR